MLIRAPHLSETLIERLWALVVGKFKNSQFVVWKNHSGIQRLNITLEESFNEPEQLDFILKAPSLVQSDFDETEMSISYSMEHRGIDFHVNCQSALFPEWVVEEMLESFRYLCEEKKDIADSLLSQTSIVSPRQFEWLKNWNATQQNYGVLKTIPSYIAQIAKTKGNSTAIIAPNRTLTFSELEDYANQIAYHLGKNGVKAGMPVGVWATRSWETIIIFLGIMKLGAFYIPLSPHDPESRIKEILDEAKAEYLLNPSDLDFTAKTLSTIQILSGSVLLEKSENGKIIENQDINSLAYVVYTSGSTGKPKGVAVTHAQAINTLICMKNKLNLTETDRILAISEFNFDLSIFDVFGSFLAGAAVVLIDDKDTKNPEAWLELLTKHRVTIYNSVPALLQLLCEYIALHHTTAKHLSLRWVLLSGDLIPPSIPLQISQHISPDCRIYALGGSTEGAIWSIGSEITYWNSNENIPYGCPLANQQIFTIDTFQNPLPPGALGELVIGGAGVAQGYWNNSTLTNERFPNLPLLGKVFLCRDLGRLNSNNGLAEFVGRMDKQAKILGIRVDLFEVERILNSMPGIELAIAATYHLNGVTKLAIFLKKQKEGKPLTHAQLVAALKGKLPKKIIPNQWIQIEDFPLTKNGKINIKTLSNLAISKELTKLSFNQGKQIRNDFDIIKAFKKQVKKNPLQIAYADSHQKLTYLELEQKVEQLSTFFGALPATPEVIGFLMPRGYPYLVAILACLRQHITFMPLGIDWPANRLHESLNNSSCKHILVMKEHPELKGVHQIPFYQTIANEQQNQKYEDIENNSRAYILFTSGSTGKPKGVQISRAALNNNLHAILKTIGLSAQDIWLSITEPTFDISLLELLGPLAVGATVLMPSNSELLDSKALTELLKKYPPTYLQTTPSRWRFLATKSMAMASLKCLLVGGEPFPVNLLQTLLPLRKKIFNLYGPTEATIWTSIAELTLQNNEIHIGKPIENTFCLVVDSFNQILKKGEIGELCVGGAGLSQGYLDSQQTKESFLKFEIFPGQKERIYKTGDLVRMDKEGKLYFHGRIDRQLKVRGYRIDPLEIESALCNTPWVNRAIVTSAFGDSETIAAYIIPPLRKSKPLAFSLFCFPGIENPEYQDFEFYRQLAKQADQHKFSGMWIPERHFDPIGAPFSAPAIVASHILASTKNLSIGAGSIILPLHHPITVAEEWSTLDCLSEGRVRLAVASGWHPDDFILAPDQYVDRKAIFFEKITQLKQAWERGSYAGKNGNQTTATVSLFPRPTQKKCPLWVSVAEDDSVFIEAGRLGLNLLTHLLMQDVSTLARKVKLYHENLIAHGFAPEDHQVTLMVHTYIHLQPEVAYKKAFPALHQYFRAHMRLVAKIQESEKEGELLSDEYFDRLVEKFINEKSLIGTPGHCAKVLASFHAAGVTEIACLVDFGLSSEEILEGVNTIAYFMSNQPSLSLPVHCDIKALKESLSHTLPPTMIPSYFMEVSDFPLTANGKIDLEKLKMSSAQSISASPFASSRAESPLIAQVIQLWQSILKHVTIDIDKDFFEQGGHSLKAIALLEQVHKIFGVEIPITDFLNHPWIRSLAEFIEKGTPTLTNTCSIKPFKCSASGRYPLTYMEKGIWIFCNLFPDTFCYHDAFLFEIAKNVNVRKMADALNKVFAEDEIFHVGFIEKDQQIFQTVIPSLIKVDIAEEIFDKFEVAINAHVQSPFSLASPPLVRAKIYKFQDKNYLQLVLHHILTDGKSLNNILKRLQRELSFTQLAPQKYPRYLDFAAQNNEISIYPEKIASYIEKMQLSRQTNTFIKNNTAVKARTFQGFAKRLPLTPKMVIHLTQAAQLGRTTFNNVMLAAYLRMLFKFVKENKIQIGIPITLRESKWEECIGLFVNFGVIALTRQQCEAWDAKTWLQEIHHKMVFVLENRSIPFPSIAAQLETNLLTEDQPVFQLAFNVIENENYENFLTPIPFDYGLARFHVELQVIREAEKIECNFIFSQTAVDQNMAMDMIAAYEHELEWFSGQDNESSSFLKYWQNVYKKLYTQVINLEKDRWAGWNNSIDGSSFSQESMQDWLYNIVSKTKRAPVKRVLEIGCGTGAIQQALKDDYISYHGIDISSEIISKLNEVYQDKNTRFSVLEAHQLETLQPALFDTIILNSIVQYFPGIDYFKDVLKKAFSLLNPAGGRIILGDLRNADWQEQFYQYLKRYDYSFEKELSISPVIIYEILDTLSIPLSVLIEPKQMKIKNELSRFRYDVIIQTYLEPPVVSSEFLISRDGSDLVTPDDFQKFLASTDFSQGPVCITHLRNANLNDEGLSPIILQDLTKKFGLEAYILLAPDKKNELWCFIGASSFLTVSFFKEFYTSKEIKQQPDTPVKMIKTNLIETSSNLEMLLKNIWQNLLHVETINHTDNFFNLGGDSLLFIRLFSEIQSRGYHLKMRDLLLCHTFSEQMALITKVNNIEV